MSAQPNEDTELLATYEGTPWLACDAGEAESEGWGLFEGDSRGVEIQRDDEADQLASDDDALLLVARRAREGSSTHLKALLITASSWYHAKRFPRA